MTGAGTWEEGSIASMVANHRVLVAEDTTPPAPQEPPRIAVNRASVPIATPCQVAVVHQTLIRRRSCSSKGFVLKAVRPIARQAAPTGGRFHVVALGLAHRHTKP